MSVLVVRRIHHKNYFMLNLNDICYIFIIWNLGDNQPEKLPPGVYYSNTELAVLLLKKSKHKFMCDT